MSIVGCDEESADIDNSLESDVSGYAIVDTGQAEVFQQILFKGI